MNYIKDYQQTGEPTPGPEPYQESDSHIDDCEDIEERIAEQEAPDLKNEMLNIYQAYLELTFIN